jgi:hypothetical protein
MDITYGSVDDTAPNGFLPRRVHFTTMTRLNEGTKEGMLTRIISGAGFTTRELPQPLGFMPYTLHSDASVAHVVGRVDQLKIDGNNVEAWGWLLDDEMGREAFKHTALKTMRGNSMDMGDVRLKVDVDYNDEGDMAITANFVEAAFAGTTLVAQPAFGSAAAVMEDELVAALAMEGDLECDLVGEPQLPGDHSSLTAATVMRYSHSAFTMEEPDELTPWQVSPDGSFVFGHLGSWEGCHTGILDRCVTIPRSHTNYARYCYSKQYTDQGHVFTGPLLLLNGHKATRAAINEAMESMENVWANITVVDGKFGPWACGAVLPDVTDEQLARAMSGRVSGHWLDGELYAVVSVPAAGFTTERQSQFQVEFDANGEVEYLAASFGIDCGCTEEPTILDRIVALEEKLGLTSKVEAGFTDDNGTFTLTIPSDPELLSLAVLAELATGDDDDDA